MNRREYIERLEQLLLVLSQEEREEALQYYTDYFEDAGAEREEDVIRELGSPEEVAAKIRAGFAGEYAWYSEQGYEDGRFQRVQEIMPCYGNSDGEWEDSVYEAEGQECDSKKSKNKGKQNVWKMIAIVVIALFAAPVIIPLGIVLVAIVFSIIFVLMAIVAFFGIAGIGMALAGAMVVVAAIAKIIVAPAAGILAAGIGCVLLAIGVFVTWLLITMAVKIVPGMIRGIVNILGIPFRKAGGHK